MSGLLDSFSVLWGAPTAVPRQIPLVQSRNVKNEIHWTCGWTLSPTRTLPART
jgi:hypothetical protein